MKFQPRRAVEDRSDVHAALPALSLAAFHFRRDVIAGFLAEQASLIRDAGAGNGFLPTGIRYGPRLPMIPRCSHSCRLPA